MMAVDQITVRLITAADLAALHAREAHPDAHLAQRHLDRQQAGGYFYALAESQGVILGMSALDCDPSGSLCPELKSLWVYPESRRQGAARALTTFLEGQARELGFVEVFLRVDPDNAAAIPMYIGLDYTPTGDHIATDYQWVDATGSANTRTQTDAVYRKSLLLTR
ncbi:MAG: GNAT family N-acetyltransferase [Propionicimonas sp.]|uniref:GNAT family N-acetyltransferase n=1 Tax=Propionicimonas sp. TaxID=1955623 RepID=UPI002B1F3923|nr:GNAT family N-acetyltransferase [Propionicimonas sp.]MEA4944342.1 GNAT family N-acetyltransferase [Propionicimonas sp.]MEA5051945.1 GNAT family N-acetyltransferase [Propionicimonas sp.]MEA5116882.1 GNAT family N-acetyltransferase [Propionicimonas sp.]